MQQTGDLTGTDKPAANAPTHQKNESNASLIAGYSVKPLSGPQLYTPVPNCKTDQAMAAFHNENPWMRILFTYRAQGSYLYGRMPVTCDQKLTVTASQFSGQLSNCKCKYLNET